MKRIIALLCSLFVLAAFAGVAPALEKKVMQLKPPKTPNKPDQPHDMAKDGNAAGQSSQKETTQTGKKVEPKKEEKKNGEKK